jgi:hypothetical protein
VRVTTVAGESTKEQSLSLEAEHTAAIDLRGADQVWLTVESGAPHAAISVSGTADEVPYVSVLPLVDAPVTALSVPVRQVGS